MYAHGAHNRVRARILIVIPMCTHALRGVDGRWWEVRRRVHVSALLPGMAGGS